MYIIIENNKIVKVSISKDNTEMIEVSPVPEDLISFPDKYLYQDGEILQNPEWKEIINPEIEN